MRSILFQLPVVNFEVLKCLATLLVEIKKQSDVNKMSMSNLVTCIVPSLDCCPAIVTYSIQHYDYFYSGIIPPEKERKNTNNNIHLEIIEEERKPQRTSETLSSPIRRSISPSPLAVSPRSPNGIQSAASRYTVASPLQSMNPPLSLSTNSISSSPTLSLESPKRASPPNYSRRSGSPTRTSTSRRSVSPDRKSGTSTRSSVSPIPPTSVSTTPTTPTLIPPISLTASAPVPAPSRSQPTSPRDLSKSTDYALLPPPMSRSPSGGMIASRQRSGARAQLMASGGYPTTYSPHSTPSSPHPHSPLSPISPRASMSLQISTSYSPRDSVHSTSSSPSSPHYEGPNFFPLSRSAGPEIITLSRQQRGYGEVSPPTSPRQLEAIEAMESRGRSNSAAVPPPTFLFETDDEDPRDRRFSMQVKPVNPFRYSRSLPKDDKESLVSRFRLSGKKDKDKYREKDKRSEKEKLKELEKLRDREKKKEKEREKERERERDRERSKDNRWSRRLTMSHRSAEKVLIVVVVNVIILHSIRITFREKSKIYERTCSVNGRRQRIHWPVPQKSKHDLNGR